MSGYNRSCSRVDSSILLVAQCAAALSMMPTSAPSCWAQGVTAASYNEYAILGFSFGVGFYGRDHRGGPVLLPTGSNISAVRPREGHVPGDEISGFMKLYN